MNGGGAVAVGEFVASARTVVEGSFAPLWLAGEVANFTRAASGHWYFVLRDELGQADCVMLARQNALAGGAPREGAAVEVFAQPTIYPPRGRFQLAVRFLRATGAGRLHQLFVARKREWAARGWFDSSRKRGLPFLPERVGVVGSRSGAAVRDVFACLARRLPSARAVLFPAPAQGADAAEKIAAALAEADGGGCDVLILCRGGGGIEDLWAFNEEEVVAAVVRCKTPVVTGIGHEIDETLADFAADARAATPTAAAELAAPDGKELLRQTEKLAKSIRAALSRRTSDESQRLDIAARRLRRALAAKTESAGDLRWRGEKLRDAAARRLQIAAEGLRARKLRPPNVALYAAEFSRIGGGLSRAAFAEIARARQSGDSVAAAFSALNPQRTLQRGYSITTAENGKAVTDATTLASGETLKIQFARGQARATVAVDGGEK